MERRETVAKAIYDEIKEPWETWEALADSEKAEALMVADAVLAALDGNA